MYNGIGVASARGSGTNGYVQANKFYRRPRSGRGGVDASLRSDNGDGLVRQQRGRTPNKEMIMHDRKRQVQLLCVKLQDKLEEQGYGRTEGARCAVGAKASARTHARTSERAGWAQGIWWPHAGPDSVNAGRTQWPTGAQKKANEAFPHRERARQLLRTDAHAPACERGGPRPRRAAHTHTHTHTHTRTPFLGNG